MNPSEDNNAAGQPTPPAGDDRMNILEQRLAEIRAKQDEPAETPGAAASPTPSGGATQTERPEQGPADLPPGEDPGAGTAEATPAEVSQQGATMPAPDSPEVAAAVESARHLPTDMPATEGLLSAPQARAMAHYGEAMAPEAPAAPDLTDPVAPTYLSDSALSPEVEALSGIAGETATTPVGEEFVGVAAGQADVPAGLAPEEMPAAETPTPSAQPTHHDHPVAPVVPLPVAADAQTLENILDQTPEGVATLPTSNTESAEVAADLADAHRAEEQPTGTAENAPTPQQALEAAASITNSHEAIIQPAADESSALTMSATEPVTPQGGAAEGGEPSAESATAEADDYVSETPAPDFATLDLDQQAAFILDLLRRSDARRNRQQILDLNRQYEAAVGSARAASRQKFGEDANAPKEFAFQVPANQAELNKAMQEFRESQQRDRKTEDANRGQNLTAKRALLDRLRELVEAAETKDSSAKLKALQQEWKAAGPVPQTDSQELWS